MGQYLVLKGHQAPSEPNFACPPAFIERHSVALRPHQFAAGIDQVLVNGITTFRDGEHTGALAGRTLRRQTDFAS